MKKTVTLEGVNVKQKEINGEMKYSVGILIKNKDGEDMWLNTLLDNRPNWNKGETLEIDAYQKEYNGKTYWNFKLLTQNNSQLEQRVATLEKRLDALEGKQVAKDLGGKVVKEIKVEDLNFE